MCANCGLPSAPGHWTEAGEADAHGRIRARFRRARLLQSVLDGYGLTAFDDGVTPGIMIATKTGDHVIAADLAEVWQVAERLGRACVDPLDPRFTGGQPEDETIQA